MITTMDRVDFLRVIARDMSRQSREQMRKLADEVEALLIGNSCVDLTCLKAYIGALEARDIDCSDAKD